MYAVFGMLLLHSASQVGGFSGGRLFWSGLRLVPAERKFLP